MSDTFGQRSYAPAARVSVPRLGVGAQPQPRSRLGDRAGELEMILDNTPFLLTRCSRDLRYLYVSKARAAMLGRTADEIVGKPIIDVIGPEAFERIRPHIETVLRGQRVEYEAEVTYTNVGPRHVHVSYVPERDEQNQVIGWIASTIDITERERAIEGQDQLEKLAAEMGIGTWDWDSRTDSLSWTPEIEAIYGLEGANAKTYADFRNRIHPDDLHDVETRAFSAIAARETFQLECRIVRPDGQMRWVMAVGRGVYDKVTSELVRIVGHCIDITERKASEAQAELQRKELTHLMRVATVGGLSAGIAHELAQPLAAILANAQAAKLLLARKNPNLEEISEVLQEIVQDDVRAGKTIQHLRKLLRKEERHEEPINLNDLLASTLQLLHSELITNKIRVNSQLTATSQISGDWVELQQVFLNLITNAIDAMASTPASKRRLSIITGEADKGCAEVSMRDHGPGMTPDQLSRIFQPFITTKGNGLGLGLSICSMIVKSHGGQITLKNATDGGIVATVSLPKRVPTAV